MTWTEATIHVIDFEGSRGSGILEFGLVVLEGAEIVETSTRLCRPTGEIRNEDYQTHRIGRAEAEAHEPFAFEWDRFSQARKNGPFAAHFASVENSLLKSVWPYPGLSPDFSGMNNHSAEWGPWVDTGRVVPRLFNGISGAGLGELIAAFGCEAELKALGREHCPPSRDRYHCALYDALGSALLLMKMAEYPEFRNRSLRWLLEMSAGSADGGEGLRQGRLF